MTTPEILASLERYTGKFPFLAMRAAVQEREVITPELLRVVQAVADDAPKYAADRDYMLHMFALFLLGQFREKRAYPPLIKLISWPGETVDRLLGDTITEGLPSLLASVFDGDLEALVQAALNEQAEPFVRSSVMKAMTLVYLENRITREQLLSALRQLYRDLKREGNPQPWNGLADAIANAGLGEMLSEMRAVFEQGLADGGMDDFDKYLEPKISGPRDKTIANFKIYHHLIEDASAEMSWWATFHQEDRPRTGRVSGLPKQNLKPALRYALASMNKASTPAPISVEPSRPKIGRNDPCPCGSGKKYKKCCLHRDAQL